ncbi:hypothetical protein NEF87_001699 [Candidatus Lokiarchaeum ossiferum]|uniref:Transglutaminase-like domain-containing protein n=1 Tax=Candidatus Lokiarchaeum ossiferum TaxID=2951803 RepID=A0ABY6HPH3_9ARCH|nr:hypothetical protein NEF87_001699 [Candidatus Lokiarchaeum sp. B-35]
MPQPLKSQIKEIQLIIDKDDVIVKHFVAGIWKGSQTFTGFSFSTSLKLDAVYAYERDKIPARATLRDDHHTIDVQFTTAIQPNSKYVYEIQLLLNPKDIIQKLGSLNIIEWPKEDLTEIIFLRNAGEIFFSSALAKIKIDQKNHTRNIVPGKFSKNLTSHARNASAIRIEWGKSPQFRLHFDYIIKNVDNQTARNLILETYIPPSTKFQNSRLLSLNNSKIDIDEDGNSLLTIKVDEIPAHQTKALQFDLIITPKGNSDIVLPIFGKWEEYRKLTLPGSTGSAMLLASQYWPISDSIIQELVRILKKNAKNASEFITLAFEFVNQKISYEMNGIREDAVKTMNDRRGDCSEMSDLFVCILRAGGIPARIVHGWSVDLDNLSLGPHAWCEFFSPDAGGWRSADPTWGFLTGTGVQHICRQREGLVTDQHTYSWKYQGQTKIEVQETTTLSIE